MIEAEQEAKAATKLKKEKERAKIEQQHKEGSYIYKRSKGGSIQGSFAQTANVGCRHHCCGTSTNHGLKGYRAHMNPFLLPK